MAVKVKEIDYMSFGLAFGIFSVVVYLVLAIMLIIVKFDANYLSPIAFSMILLSLILLFLISFVVGIIFAFLYNSLISRWIKIKVKTERK